MCLLVENRLFTGDPLMIGGTGRTDLPTGDPEALYDSLFSRVLKLDPALTVHPAREYRGRGHSTIAQQLAENPRLQERDRASPAFFAKHSAARRPTKPVAPYSTMS